VVLVEPDAAVYTYGKIVSLVRVILGVDLGQSRIEVESRGVLVDVMVAFGSS